MCHHLYSTTLWGRKCLLDGLKFQSSSDDVKAEAGYISAKIMNMNSLKTSRWLNWVFLPASSPEIASLQLWRKASWHDGKSTLFASIVQAHDPTLRNTCACCKPKFSSQRSNALVQHRRGQQCETNQLCATGNGPHSTVLPSWRPRCPFPSTASAPSNCSSGSSDQNSCRRQTPSSVAGEVEGASRAGTCVGHPRGESHGHGGPCPQGRLRGAQGLDSWLCV